MILKEEVLSGICERSSKGFYTDTATVERLVENLREARAQRDALERALRWALVEIEVEGNPTPSELRKAQKVLAENSGRGKRKE